MKKSKLWSTVAVIMGMVLILYIATLAMPHMNYVTSERVPVGDGTETKLETVEKSMSTFSFLFFPDASKAAAVKNQMKQEFNDLDYTINGATTGLLFLIVIAILGAVCAFMKSDDIVATLLPLTWFVLGLFVYFTNSYVKLGGADYIVQLVLVFVVGIMAVALLIAHLPEFIAERKQIKMEIRITKERELGMKSAREAAEK